MSDGALLTGCHAFIDGVTPSYGYQPTLAAGIIFCILFSLSFCGHLFQSAQYHRWSSYLLTAAALTEILGWAARTWSSKCPYNNNAFLMQITTLVIAPIFVAAAIYVTLGYLIIRRGAEYSILKPKLYLYIFCTSDFIALLIQAGGAAEASHDFSSGIDPTGGTHIVAGGIIFQLVTMTAFFCCLALFLRRSQHISTRAENLVLCAMVISYVAIYIRSIYRAIALLQGWTGNLTSHERYFIALDGTMLIISLILFNLLDPVVLLKTEATERTETEYEPRETELAKKSEKKNVNNSSEA